MSEAEFEQKAVVIAVQGAVAEQAQEAAELRVATPGGRFHVRWDENGSATPLGQLPFFAEFQEVSGLFERWVDNCPMAYTSPNAPTVRDVLGTWLLSILDGQRRYAHVTGLRGDAVAPQILGMNKIVSDESLRRSLAQPGADGGQALPGRGTRQPRGPVGQEQRLDGPGAGREYA